ncbi:hypothetical protein L596_009105 [Steinernema carpocapsae]|uniref:Uncharacterized protein n=1 Tax=Steinernema carpocapsae TaxID=34508 RepID=A0A4U5PEY0_STECR|nr:hypothetical protein L596_009105 [Steinernema carpocapsae]
MGNTTKTDEKNVAGAAKKAAAKAAGRTAAEAAREQMQKSAEDAREGCVPQQREGEGPLQPQRWGGLRSKRQSETPEDASADDIEQRQHLDAIRHAAQRMQEKPEERNERLQYARENARVRRFLEDPNVLNERVENLQRMQIARRRTQQSETLCLARRVREVDAHNIGSFDVACTACGALHFACEVIHRNRGMFNDCCALGKVNLDDQMSKFREFPEYLRQLFMREHPDKREERVFHENIR